MYEQTPSSSPEVSAKLPHILWVPGSLLGIALLLGFRFYESGKFPNLGLTPNSAPMLMAESVPPLETPAPVSTGEKDSARLLPAPKTEETASSKGQGPEKPQPAPAPTPSNALTEGTGTLVKAEADKVEETPKDMVVDESVDILNLTTEEVKILQSLASRRGDVEKREKSLQEREQLLEVAENRIDDKVQELQKIRTILKKMLAKFQDHEKERMRGLVKIYELMKPGKAALIFEGLSLDVLLDVVDMMKESKLSPVLESMDPRAAQRLTEELASRRKFTEELNRLNQQEEAASQTLEIPESMAEKPVAKETTKEAAEAPTQVEPPLSQG